MAYNINLVVLSGEVVDVKQKYGNQKLWIHFTLTQPSLIISESNIVGRSYEKYPIFVFDGAEGMKNKIREGAKVVVQGKLSIYTGKDLTTKFSVVADKIDFCGQPATS